MYSQRTLLASALILVVATATSAFAANGSPLQNGQTRVGFRAEQASRARLLAAPASASQAKELVANPARAYPASCFSDTPPSAPGNIEPLPVALSGPTYGGAVTLYATDAAGDNSTENVTITIWRVACSSSGDQLAYDPDGGPVAATLIRIQRQQTGVTTLYPTFPSVRIAQGSIGFDDPTFRDYVRAVPEPNTVVADTLIDAPVIDNTTYVLENYPYQGASIFAFNQAFQIRFDNGYTNGSGQPVGQVVFSVPAYNPTPATYPAASLPLPINGYLSGSWYDPTHSGEGILTQVFDIDGTSRIFSAAWYTYDTTGRPFWLFAQGTLTIGATSLQNMAVTYRTGGGFAGNFTPPAPQQNWGTMSVQFPNCNKMTFSYNGAAGSVQNGPSGSGTKTFSRIGSINSLSCQ